ncbi:hypothetical protein [Brevibacterium renqingii]|uniref:hypothetical protein n=1 Tax=Brevibacterium renqingii TaxID=2776916 RepID=UPI001AE0963F|nr:hypothetical protein [Brevibacterium renqingii]
MDIIALSIVKPFSTVEVCARPMVMSITIRPFWGRISRLHIHQMTSTDTQF